MKTVPSLNTTPPLLFSPSRPPLPRLKTKTKLPPPHRTHFPLNSLSPSTNQPPPKPRTLYPGGFKRPEIQVPNLILQLHPDQLRAPLAVLDLVDQAVANWVGIVLLTGGETTGGGRSFYEAACLLKSLIKERAYFLVAERVDVAVAVNASGVVLSDQGLPAIVARNTLMDPKSESVVVLPLVARIVETADAALLASNSEGADFLIFSVGDDKGVDSVLSTVFEDVKIPIFVAFTSREEAISVLKSGASGLVVSLEDLKSLSDDVLGELFCTVRALNNKRPRKPWTENKPEIDLFRRKPDAGFIKLEDREKQLVETERSVLLEAINVIQKAAPMMKEVSLLVDAVSQIDEPFLLAIVGEFNSGKSSVINALLGERYLKEGVVPTTNEITFLCYSELDSQETQRCERHPDGQYICYLPAPILKEMNIVDTPGTNVILQRQQRLTEEFVPRADLLLFVVSADRPLTESEVNFLRYTQQWKKKVVFVLNKSDLYQNAIELEEAISFIKENTCKLLNTEHVTLFPVSARSALEAKLSAYYTGKDCGQLLFSDSRWRISSFLELEKFLNSFLDGSTSTGMERMKLKLETPIGIAEQLLSVCDTLVRQDCQYAKQDLSSMIKIVDSVKDCVMKMENESISWRRQALSLIDATKSRIVKLIESTLQISNLDLVASYVFRGEKTATMPATSRVENDIIGPALSDAHKLLGEYVLWLESNNAREGRLYKESFEKRWPQIVYSNTQVHLENNESLKREDELSLKVIEGFNASATSKLFDQEIRKVLLGTFGGLGAAGLSASLLTSVLPTTLEDLLALSLCSAGGFIAVSNFPARRQRLVDKVNRIADAVACEVEDAMQKDLLEATEKLLKFVKMAGKPYEDAARERLDKLLDIQEELSNVQKTLRTLQVEIQNLHIS
ncbi:MMR_HSR1 domain-containing protein, partial [Cephalotus follicularis]